MIRIFSDNNVNEFAHPLESADWSSVYNKIDVNTACNMFSVIIQSAFNKAFRLTRLSRKRQRDKMWITSALKKSSITKNKLYKHWLSSTSIDDEIKYKQCRKIFKQAAAEKNLLPGNV